MCALTSLAFKFTQRAERRAKKIKVELVEQRRIDPILKGPSGLMVGVSRV
jgi:hypothetical protein